MRQKVHSRYLIYFISAFAAITGLLFGYDTGVISGALLFIRQDFHLSSAMVGVTVSSVLLGALLGSAMSGKMTDKMGRHKSLVIVSFVFIIGTLITAIAASNQQLIIGRIILGMAIGTGSFVAPLYLAEMAPPKARGFLVTLNQLAITLGIVAAYVVDYVFSGQGEWRWMFGCGVVPALLLFIGTVFLPESPRWLVLKGFSAEAAAVLETIRPTAAEANQELLDIQQSITEKKPSWRLLFSKAIRPVFYMSLGLSFFQQVTGINAVIYYAPTILQQAGFGKATTAILATLAIGIFNVVFTVIALPLIDCWGRRPLLFMGLTGMFFSLIAQSIAFYFPHLECLRWVTMGSMIIYIACFAMSLGPMMWLLISEIFPLEVRGLGISIAVSVCWAFNMLVALTLMSLIDFCGVSGLFLLYAAFCLLGIVCVYYFVPETKGCSLEQIENNIHAGKQLRELGVSLK